jgi:hypothetical protein
MTGSFVELADYRLVMHVKVYLVRWHRGARQAKEGLVVYRQSCAVPKGTILSKASAIPFPAVKQESYQWSCFFHSSHQSFMQTLYVNGFYEIIR